MDERERANDELVTRFVREWDAPHLDGERMAASFADEAVYHNVPFPRSRAGQRSRRYSGAGARGPRSAAAPTSAGSSTTRPPTATWP